MSTTAITTNSSATVATTTDAAEASARNSKRTVRCRTTDGEITRVKESLLYQCTLFRQMYADLGMAEMDVEEGTFELPLEMTKQILNKIVEWCNYHCDKPDPVIEHDEITQERKWFELDEFQRKFLDLPVDELSNLLTAANFLDLKTLYIYGAQSMADKIRKAGTPEAIRELLGLEDDLTAEEKEEIARQSVWCNY